MIGRLCGELLGIRLTQTRVDVVALPLNTELVVPRHTNGSVTNKFSLYVGRFLLPVAKGIFLDGITRRSIGASNKPMASTVTTQ